jgi:hypothetical protein
VAISAGSVWAVWYVMLTLLRRLSGGIDHPPVDDRPLPQSRAVLFWAVVLSFVLIFMPVPIRPAIGMQAQADAQPLQNQSLEDGR